MLHIAYIYIHILFYSLIYTIIIQSDIHIIESCSDSGRPPTQRPVGTRTARVSTRVCELTWTIRHNTNQTRHVQPWLAQPCNITPPDSKRHRSRNLAICDLAIGMTRHQCTHKCHIIGCDARINSSVRLVIWPRPALLLKTLCSPLRCKNHQQF